MHSVTLKSVIAGNSAFGNFLSSTLKVKLRNTVTVYM